MDWIKFEDEKPELKKVCNFRNRKGVKGLQSDYVYIKYESGNMHLGQYCHYDEKYHPFVVVLGRDGDRFDDEKTRKVVEWKPLEEKLYDYNDEKHHTGEEPYYIEL